MCVCLIQEGLSQFLSSGGHNLLLTFVVSSSEEAGPQLNHVNHQLGARFALAQRYTCQSVVCNFCSIQIQNRIGISLQPLRRVTANKTTDITHCMIAILEKNNPFSR